MQSVTQQAAKAPAPQAQPVTKQPDAMVKMMAEQRPQAAPQSLIERLKMARGETVSQPIRREPIEDMAPPITRNAGGPSVIEILKGMRK